MKKTYKILSHKKEAFIKKIDKLNNKLFKIDKDMRVKIIKEDFFKIESHFSNKVCKENPLGCEIFNDFIEFEVDLPDYKNIDEKYEVIGKSIRCNNSNEVIYEIHKKDYIDEIMKANHFLCENCGRKHKNRKKTFYIIEK